MSEENYLEMIEQLRHDRDKYIGMWRSQCNIAEEVMRERDRLTEELEECKRIAAEKTVVRARLEDELAEARVEINRRDELCKKCEREYEAELARYKQGVEVDDFVNHYGVLEAEYELRPDLWGKRVRVLVMKVEEE